MKKHPMLEMMRSLINDPELMALPEEEGATELRERALVGYREMYRKIVDKAESGRTSGPGRENQKQAARAGVANNRSFVEDCLCVFQRDPDKLSTILSPSLRKRQKVWSARRVRVIQGSEGSPGHPDWTV